ncbi:GMC oxidoreductase domain-containing protein [Trichoderma breve]|uniref:GMC oxidoreductase domain-containing protein n=1 Tax=Trichoderma breve TaxID=2034170 RepID=A0A9W9JSC0_9HYPO|nr:GMC oxidoreductase domain-containing protein [Trichoderma breve]KAJ4865468.1 GMC oxidoreductase domain-containing protein [Trichoderma breve]
MWPFGSSYPERTPEDVDGKIYDYVIVGGGAAGCVLASRLSEDPAVSVLLLEKGFVKDNLFSRIPLLSQNPMMSGLQVVKHLSQMPSALNRKLSLFWAEALGGSTRINAMLLTRGPPGNYNEWSQDLGLKDWGWESVEPYFRKSENAIGHPDAEYRGHHGPVETRQPAYPFSFHPYVEIAARRLGLPVHDDCNDPDASAQGYFRLDQAIDSNGRRISAYQAWLSKETAIARASHLTVCTGVTVSRLDIDTKSRKVIGVQIRRRGQTDKRECYVQARREIVLCAGAIGTPQILMRSGIGPKDHLQQLGIPIVQESSAVGNNLMDHVAVPVMSRVPTRDTIHSLYNPFVFIWQFILWLFFGRGLLSTSSTSSTIFARTTAIDDATMQPQNAPDIEVMIIPVESYFDVYITEHSLLTWLCTLVQPFSRGNIRLTTTNPEHPPEITHPLLRDERDFQPMRKAIRFALRLGFTKLLPKQQRMMGGTTELPEWQDISDEAIDDYTKRAYQSALHYSCTCRMSLDASDGVVDQKLRVFGIEGLRIADASVFPKIPSAHTMAPTMMVAERCADFIKETWREK